jgi:hypothetical protein
VVLDRKQDKAATRFLEQGFVLFVEVNVSDKTKAVIFQGLALGSVVIMRAHIEIVKAVKHKLLLYGRLECHAIQLGSSLLGRSIGLGGTSGFGDHDGF